MVPPEGEELQTGKCVGVNPAPFLRWSEFLAAAVSRFCVCVKVQPLLKGDKTRSAHDGEVTVQNLRQQGDENIDAGTGRRWKNYYFI